MSPPQTEAHSCCSLLPCSNIISSLTLLSLQKINHRNFLHFLPSVLKQNWSTPHLNNPATLSPCPRDLFCKRPVKHRWESAQAPEVQLYQCTSFLPLQLCNLFCQVLTWDFTKVQLLSSTVVKGQRPLFKASKPSLPRASGTQSLPLQQLHLRPGTGRCSEQGQWGYSSHTVREHQSLTWWD